MPAKSGLIVLVVAVAMAAAIGLWLYGDRFDVVGWVEWIDDHPLAAILMLVAGHALTAIFALPSWVFLSLFGYLFGLPLGFLLAWGSTTLASAASFGVGRYLARPWVAKRLLTVPRLAALDLAVRRKGFPIVLLSRLSLVIPMHLLSYAYAVSGVPVGAYLAGSIIGLLPAITLYVALGAGAQDLTQLLASGASSSPLYTLLLVVGIVVALGVTVWLGRLSNQMLDEAMTADDDIERPRGA